MIDKIKEVCHEDDAVYKSVEDFPKEKLMKIVEEGLDIELIEDAMQKLLCIDENYVLAKGIEFLKNDSFDPYFQACIFDFIYDLDKEVVLDCISNRTSNIDFYLFKDMLGTIITFTTYEDFIKMKNHKAYSNFLLIQYEKYDENEKNEINFICKLTSAY